MPAIHLDLNGDDEWEDLDDDRRIIHGGTDWTLAVLPEGLRSGGVSLALRLDFPQGLDAPQSLADPATVITEMTLATWIAATCAIRGRYPEAFAGTPLAEST